MRFEKVLLINKNFDDYGSSRPMLNLGYLSESLKSNRIECKVMDLNLGYSSKDVLKRIQTFNPDLVGFSIFTNGLLQMNELIDLVKAQNPDLQIIVGGPHVSSVRGEIMHFNRNISFGFLNESEYSLVDLCRAKSLSEISGLMYYDSNGDLKINQPELISDLDALPWPRYESFELDKYINEMFIVTSRGCPYACIYCAVRNTLGSKVRYRSVENVIEEMSYWYKKGRRIFNFVDDNLTFKYDRFFELCGAISANGMDDLVLRASNGIRADKIDRKMLQRMKEVGFKSIAIAVEGGNNKVLKLIKKSQTIEEVEACIANAVELGFEVSLTFVYGAPGETYEDILDSVALAKKYKIFKADFYNLVPYPATPLWHWVEKNNAWCVDDPIKMLSYQDKNLRFSSSEGYPFFETPELSKKDKIKISKMLRKVTLEIQRDGMAQLFERYGPLKMPLAWLTSTKTFNRFIFSNNCFRKISENIRFKTT